MVLTPDELKQAATRRSQELYGADYAFRYWEQDREEAKTAYYIQLSDHLRSLALSFDHPIVIDFACGTGRYFHAMEGAKVIHGIDLSEHMLRAAKKSIMGVSAGAKLELHHGGLEALDRIKKADFAYAIGVFGEHCVIDVEAINAFHRVLGPGGIFYFSIPDSDNRRLRKRTFKRRLMEALYPLLPTGQQKKLGARWLDMSMDKDEIRDLIAQSAFGCGKIERETIKPESWNGRHFFMTLVK